MALARGDRIGPYEIVAEAGSGGMGEVYKARDTRLGRTVAIKTISGQLSAGQAQRDRFEQEARAISNLNHPHICTLHDLGRHDGFEYLVMEYLDGQPPTGPLPLKLALTYAVQIADALDAAHRVGIIHRDLKPGNVLVTKAGVKLLDFGLAKFSAGATAKNVSATDTLPLTEQGVLIGTPQYMAPEQLERKEADARSDIFAFGCVLYEMLTGKQAFGGGSPASVIAAVMRSEPEPLTLAAPAVPAVVARIVARCLAKDPEQRWQTVRDLQAELLWAHEQLGAQPRSPEILLGGKKRWLWAAGAGALLVTAIAASMHTRGAAVEQTQQAMHLIIPPPPGTLFDNSWASIRAPQIAISPDGQHLAFVAAKPGESSALWVRRLDEPVAKMIGGTEDASAPFWSPDSRTIAYFAQGKLFRIGLTGGPPQQLADITDGRGGSWGARDAILYAPTSGGLIQVSAKGGEVRPATTLVEADGEASHRWPHFLPDGEHFLYQARSSNSANRSIYVGSLRGNLRKKLVRSNGGALYSAGYLFYLDGTVLIVQHFDIEKLELSGDRVPIADPVGLTSTGYPSFTASVAGNLAVFAEPVNENGQLTWYDPTGKELQTVSETGDYLDFRVSPDALQVAVSL